MAMSGSPQVGHKASSVASSMFPCIPVWPQPQFPREELREEGTKPPIHHISDYPHASLGPLNALVASIKDSSMVPLGTSDHCRYVLSCMSSKALIPFGSEAVVYLNGLTRPVGAVLVL